MGRLSKSPPSVTTTLQHKVEKGWADSSQKVSQSTGWPLSKPESQSDHGLALTTGSEETTPSAN